MRRTKIIGTIGPASARRVPELVEAGMDIARVNFSHGSHDDHTNSFGTCEGPRFCEVGKTSAKNDLFPTGL